MRSEFSDEPIERVPMAAASASDEYSVIPKSNLERVPEMFKTMQVASAVALAAAFLCGPAYAVDADAALQLARQNNCLKCHAVEKDKDGPAYKKVAQKYKGKPDAEEKLIHHITSGEKAKFPDGHEEEHKIVKTSPPKDMAQIKNLVQWILAQ
jgi:cytochrome c